MIMKTFTWFIRTLNTSWMIYNSEVGSYLLYVTLVGLVVGHSPNLIQTTFIPEYEGSVFLPKSRIYWQLPTASQLRRPTWTNSCLLRDEPIYRTSHCDRYIERKISNRFILICNTCVRFLNSFFIVFRQWLDCGLTSLQVFDYIISYKVNNVFQIYDWRSLIFVWLNLYCYLGTFCGGSTNSDDDI